LILRSKPVVGARKENFMIAGTPKPAVWSPPCDADIRDILIQRIDLERQGVGMVVGVIDRQGRRIVAHGALGQGDTRPLDGDTVFEIGSITKVFTSLLLTGMAERGEVDLSDLVAKHLPPSVRMPERGGEQITLAHLATHTSGLPRWPSDISPGDLSPKDWMNPYADYTVHQLYAFLSRYTLRRDIGADHLYSNLGVGLLGHVLALRAGASYEALVRERITGPLGMTSTAIELSPELNARFAMGHDQERRPVAPWRMPTFAGAGALRSTANDLLKFLAGELGYVDTSLRPAMAAQLGPRGRSSGDYIQGLGWRIEPDAVGETIWHGGATGGYRCFMLFDRNRRVGVVVLTNSASTRNDDIGFHVLSGRPLQPPPLERATIRLGADVLERYVGQYEISPRLNLFVTREDERLFAQVTGQWRFEVFPESLADFFWKVVDAQVTFESDLRGCVTGLVFRQNGRDLRAVRIG
jgi:D-alanyl-D-alanine-carboxypeptidase/D-alanyl-D-alanine-endopeptidase